MAIPLPKALLDFYGDIFLHPHLQSGLYRLAYYSVCLRTRDGLPHNNSYVAVQTSQTTLFLLQSHDVTGIMQILDALRTAHAGRRRWVVHFGRGSYSVKNTQRSCHTPNSNPD